MDLSQWWRVFLTTFDQNHGRKCGKSLTSKASCKRNLFHQNKWWMEYSIVMFWGDWGKTSGANIQTSGTTTPGPSIMMLQLMRHSLCGSFWLLRRRWQSSPTHLTHRTSPHAIFPVPKDEIETQVATFWQHWRDPKQIAEGDEDADAKLLPEVLLNMEILLELLHQCQGGLLWRRWGRREISVSG